MIRLFPSLLLLYYSCIVSFVYLFHLFVLFVVMVAVVCDSVRYVCTFRWFYKPFIICLVRLFYYCFVCRWFTYVVCLHILLLYLTCIVPICVVVIISIIMFLFILLVYSIRFCSCHLGRYVLAIHIQITSIYRNTPTNRY